MFLQLLKTQATITRKHTLHPTTPSQGKIHHQGERERERAKARETTPIERKSGAERGARGTVLHPAGC